MSVLMSLFTAAGIAIVFYLHVCTAANDKRVHHSKHGVGFNMINETYAQLSENSKGTHNSIQAPCSAYACVQATTHTCKIRINASCLLKCNVKSHKVWQREIALVLTRRADVP